MHLLWMDGWTDCNIYVSGAVSLSLSLAFILIGKPEMERGRLSHPFYSILSHPRSSGRPSVRRVGRLSSPRRVGLIVQREKREQIGRREKKSSYRVELNKPFGKLATESSILKSQ